MVLYTPVAHQEIFAGMQDQTDQQVHEIDYYGRKILVEPVSPAHGKIIKLISGDSNDYLMPELQPGNFITYSSITN